MFCIIYPIPPTVADLLLTYGLQGLLYIAVPRTAIICIFAVIVLIGQWRAASNYTGKKVWAVTIKILTILAIAPCLWRISESWKLMERSINY